MKKNIAFILTPESTRNLLHLLFTRAEELGYKLQDVISPEKKHGFGKAEKKGLSSCIISFLNKNKYDISNFNKKYTYHLELDMKSFKNSEVSKKYWEVFMFFLRVKTKDYWKNCKKTLSTSELLLQEKLFTDSHSNNLNSDLIPDSFRNNKYQCLVLNPSYKLSYPTLHFINNSVEFNIHLSIGIDVKYIGEVIEYRNENLHVIFEPNKREAPKLSMILYCGTHGEEIKNNLDEESDEKNFFTAVLMGIGKNSTIAASRMIVYKPFSNKEDLDKAPPSKPVGYRWKKLLDAKIDCFKSIKGEFNSTEWEIARSLRTDATNLVTVPHSQEFSQLVYKRIDQGELFLSRAYYLLSTKKGYPNASDCLELLNKAYKSGYCKQNTVLYEIAYLAIQYHKKIITIVGEDDVKKIIDAITNKLVKDSNSYAFSEEHPFKLIAELSLKFQLIIKTEIELLKKE